MTNNMDFGEKRSKLTNAIDENKLTAGIFLDLSKSNVFDTVDHSIIISKLEHYGVRGIALKWFKNYLLNRYQIVKLKNNQSDKKKKLNVAYLKDRFWANSFFYCMLMIF